MCGGQDYWGHDCYDGHVYRIWALLGLVYTVVHQAADLIFNTFISGLAPAKGSGDGDGGVGRHGHRARRLVLALNAVTWGTGWFIGESCTVGGPTYEARVAPADLHLVLGRVDAGGVHVAGGDVLAPEPLAVAHVVEGKRSWRDKGRGGEGWTGGLKDYRMDG